MITPYKKIATFKKQKSFLVKDQFLSNRDYYKDDFLDVYVSQALALSLSHFGNFGNFENFENFGNFINFGNFKNFRNPETF